MGVHNQQRRAARAKDRRRRRAPSAQFDAGHTVRSSREAEAVDEQIAQDLAEAVGYLSVRHDRCAEIPIRRLLDHGSVPQRRSTVTHQLSRLLLARTETAWSAGWRPLDLHTFIGRELDGSAQAIVGDAMAAQLASYAASTLAESWPEQLRTIGASCWWRADVDFLTGRAGAQAFEPTLLTALDLAARLSMLPTIERIDPLPGTAHPQRAEASPPDVDPRLLQRVRQLLAQAESTPYEAEAETFTAAAQSLMTRHSLDVAMLSIPSERHTGRAKPARVWVERPYEQEKVRLLLAVADANRCRTVWSSDLGFATVIGHDADLAAVEAIFTSLLVQATRAMVGEGRRATGSGASRTRSFRRSFLTGYAVRIGDRLSTATDAETESAIHRSADTGTGRDGSRCLVRVLAQRSADVDAKVEELFPQLVHKPSRFTPDLHGWHAGQRAADRATLTGETSALRPGAEAG